MNWWGLGVICLVSRLRFVSIVDFLLLKLFIIWIKLRVLIGIVLGDVWMIISIEFEVCLLCL